MAYNYYQSAAPSTYGTSNYQFGAPPAPQFHPQPSWGGLDYYRAHAVSPDPSLFHHAWKRLSGKGAIAGVGMHEARHWHRLAYAGMGEAQTMSPTDLGHAAAYEAFRTWIHNSSIYEPLSADRSRQREALIGLAVAEVSRFWHYNRLIPDKYSLREACEAAAATASVLFSVSVDEDYAQHMPYSGQPSLHRSRSFSGGAYPLESYSYDDERIHPRTRSSRHRRRSSASSMGGVSSIGMPPMQTGPSPYYHGSNPVGIPSAVNPGYGIAGSGSYAGSSYGGRASPFNDGRISPSPYNDGRISPSPYNDGRISPSPYGGGSSYNMGGAVPYNLPSTSPYNLVNTMPYGAGGMNPGHSPYHQPAINSGSYSQPLGYEGSAGVVAAPGSTVIIEQPSSSHKHRHRKSGSSSHKSRRHRTHSDVGYTTAPMVPMYASSTYSRY